MSKDDVVAFNALVSKSKTDQNHLVYSTVLTDSRSEIDKLESERYCAFEIKESNFNVDLDNEDSSQEDNILNDVEDGGLLNKEIPVLEVGRDV